MVVAISPSVVVAVGEFIDWAELVVVFITIYYFIKFLIGPSEEGEEGDDPLEAFNKSPLKKHLDKQKATKEAQAKKEEDEKKKNEEKAKFKKEKGERTLHTTRLLSSVREASADASDLLSEYAAYGSDMQAFLHEIRGKGLSHGIEEVHEKTNHLVAELQHLLGELDDRTGDLYLLLQNWYRRARNVNHQLRLLANLVSGRSFPGQDRRGNPTVDAQALVAAYRNVMSNLSQIDEALQTLEEYIIKYVNENKKETFRE